MNTNGNNDKRPSFHQETLTLAELRGVILADDALPEPRRKAMASAIRTVARMLRRPPESLPACPVQLRPLLAPVTPAMGRLTAGTWSNARSLLAAGLARVIPGFLPQRFDVVPSQGWAQCLEQVRPDRDALFLLGRLARWATVREIEPEQIDQAVFGQYERDLVERSLASEPHVTIRKTIAAWNTAAIRFEWPGGSLERKSKRIRRSLPWTAFPECLRDEVERWADHLGRDPLADRDFRPLRPASIESRLKYVRLYLGALVESGQAPEQMTQLAQVVTIQHARAALRVVYERQGQRPSQHVAGIAGVVLMLARHWLKLPHDECDALRRLARNLRPIQEGLAPRNEQRLEQLQDPRRLDEVLRLPETLAARVRRSGKVTERLAHNFQTAVAIEVFLMTGLRIANVAELSIGQTLILREDGGVAILIPRESVKNRAAFSAELPRPSSQLLREYLKTYRPLLGDASSCWLFPGDQPGTHKTTGALRAQVVKAMEGVAGVAWNPHLFRHLLAQLQLTANPGADGLVTRALGHKRADTTRQHYAGFQTRSAIRLHDELVLKHRSTLSLGKTGLVR